MSHESIGCPTPEELRQFLDGRLDVARTDQVALHIESCSSCQRRIEELDEGDASIDELVDRDHKLAFTDESQCGRVLDQIAGEKGQDASPEIATKTAASVHQGAPRRLADYELLERLGQGGMGTVYRARHTAMGTPAAVKILHPHRQADRATIERFQREMVALGRLDHPNIVRALDAGEEAGQHYLIMEFVDGTDLGRISKARGQLSIADAAEVVRQAALGLGYVHRHGRVHRDVKPSNLMLSRDGIVKLLDLGLARVEEFPMEETVSDADDILGSSNGGDLTRTHQVMGTLEYMAPEQACDSHSVDHRADLYGLGCTLYKLLTGSSPFASSKSITDLSQLMAYVQMPTPPARQRRGDIPQELSDLLDGMLAKNADDRPQSADEIAEVLEEFASGAKLRVLAESSDETHASASATAPTVEDAPTARVERGGETTELSHPRQLGSKRRWLPAVAAMLLILGLGAAFAIHHFVFPRGTIIVRAETPEVVDLLAGGSVRLVGEKRSFPMTVGTKSLPAGTYAISSDDQSPLRFSQPSIELKRNHQLVLSISRSPPQLVEPTKSPLRPKEVELPKRTDQSDARDNPEPIEYESVELIPLLDPLRDIRSDDWKIIDGSLVSNPNQPSMVVFPYQPPDEYRVELIATRLEDDDGLVLGLVAGSSHFMLSIDASPRLGFLSGFFMVNGVQINKRATHQHRGMLLPLGEPTLVEATVRRSGNRLSVEMSVGGQSVVSWRGSLSQVKGYGEYYVPPEPNVPFLANWLASIEVSDVRVTPLSGAGELVRFTDPEQDPQRAAAERAIWKGGAVSFIDETPQAIGGFELLRQFEGHAGPVKSVAFSPDGRLAASGSGWPTGDRTVRIWDVETGSQLHVLNAGYNVMHVAFSPDGHAVLASGMSAVLTSWDVQSGELLRKYTPGGARKFEEVAFTPDGTRIIAAAGRANLTFVLDAETGEVIRRIPQPHNALTFAVTPDSRRLAVGMGDGTVRVFELESGNQLQQLDGPKWKGDHTVYSMAVSPNGAQVMAGYENHTVRVWDLDSGQARIDLHSPAVKHESVFFAPDALLAAVGGHAGVTSLIELESGRILGTTPQLLGHGWTAAISPDGRTVLTGGGLTDWRNGMKRTGDYALRLWKLGEANADEVPPQASVRVDRLADIPDQPRVFAVDMLGSAWFRDEDVRVFTDLPDLQSLDLSATNLTANPLDQLGLARTAVRETPVGRAESIPMLSRLNLSNTPVRDLNAGAFTDLTSLEELNLSETPMVDDDLQAFHSLKGLVKLDLSNTAVSDKGIAALPSLPHLSHLILAGTRIETADSLSADRLPALARIDLLGTAASKESIAQIRKSFPSTEVVSDDEPIDLISRIDPERDSIHEESKQKEGTLHAPSWSKISVPVLLPQEFELEMAVIRRSGLTSPFFHLPLPDGTRVMVGYDHESHTIIQGIDGKMGLDSPAKRPGRIVATDSVAPTKLMVRVEGAGKEIRIAMYANGSEILAWEGDRSRLAPRFYGNTMNPRCPTIGSSSAFDVIELTLRPISGRVEMASLGLPRYDHDRKVAQWVVELGGVVKIQAATKLWWSWSRQFGLGDPLPSYPFRVTDLTLEGPEITDAAITEISITPLTGLKKLDVRGTRITPEGIERLRKTMPRVQIVAE